MSEERAIYTVGCVGSQGYFDFDNMTIVYHVPYPAEEILISFVVEEDET